MRRLIAYTATAALVLTGCTSVKQYSKATEDELWVKMKVSDGRTYKGALVEWDADSLLLIVWDEPKPDITVPVDRIVRVQLHRGQLTTFEGVLSRTAKETAIGAAAGTAGGLFIGALFGEPGEGAKAGLGMGVAAGLWGGVLNGVFEGEDHWEDVSLESLRRVYCALKRTPACGYVSPAPAAV